MILFYQPSHARRGVASRRSRNSGIGVLFHRSQFDWPEHILSVVLTSSHCLCRTFFHHLHFDWQTGCLFVPGVESWQVTHRLRVGLSGNVSVRTVHPIFISLITL